MSSKGDWSWIDDELRVRRMSRSELADYLGVSATAVSKWINNKQHPRFEHLARLAILFTDGDLNRLYGRARFNWADTLQHMDAQAKGMGIQPTARSAVQGDGAETFALVLPSEALYADDPITTALTAESIVTSNELLRRASQFAAMRDQSHRLIARFSGSRSPLSSRAWYGLANAEMMLGEYSQSLQAAEAARKMSRGRDDAAFVADTHYLSAECQRIMGNWSAARDHCTEARKLYDQVGVPAYAEGQMWLDWNFGRTATSEGKYDEAIEHFDRMTTAAQRIRHREGAVCQKYGVAYIHDLQGDQRDALRQYKTAQVEARRDKNVYWDAMIAWKIADVLRRQGDTLRAMQIVERTRQTYKTLDNEDMVASVTFTLAYCQLHLGDAERAHTTFAEIAARFASNVDQTTTRMARIGAHFALLTKLSMQPSPQYDELLPPVAANAGASTIPSSLSLRFVLLEALFVAEVLRLTGHAPAAHQHYAAIARRAATYGHQLEHAHALLGIVESKRLLGQPDRETLNQALALYERIGVAWGRVHARVAHALIEPNEASQQLHEAKRIAQASSFYADVELIERLRQAVLPDERHALTFA